MALTVVKYNKTAASDSKLAVPAMLIKSNPTTDKKPLIKLQPKHPGLVISNLPTSIRCGTKRNNSSSDVSVSKPKFALHTINSAGTPITTLDGKLFSVQKASGNNNLAPKKEVAITGVGANLLQQARTSVNLSGGAAITPLLRRPTLLIKRELPKRTIRSVTLELVEKKPLLHMGVSTNHLPLLKNYIANSANVQLMDFYLTLKKVRQNESMELLAEYFELTEADALATFTRTICRLARLLRFLVRWPDSKKYFDRHKNMPFEFRCNLQHVQTLIECVSTEITEPNVLEMDSSTYKYILCASPNGIITYVSEAYLGYYDDLCIFRSSNFTSAIPKYLSLVAVPGKGVRRRKRRTRNEHNAADTEIDSNTDSAEESAGEVDDHGEKLHHDQTLSRHTALQVAAEQYSNTQTLSVENNELQSSKVREFKIPRMRVQEPQQCRSQMRYMLDSLQEFKMLQPKAMHETELCPYLSEILVVAAALANLQR